MWTRYICCRCLLPLALVLHLSNPIANLQVLNSTIWSGVQEPSKGSQLHFRGKLHFNFILWNLVTTILESGTGYYHLGMGHAGCSPYFLGRKSHWTQWDLCLSRHGRALASQWYHFLFVMSLLAITSLPGWWTWCSRFHRVQDRLSFWEEGPWLKYSGSTELKRQISSPLCVVLFGSLTATSTLWACIRLFPALWELLMVYREPPKL